MILGLTGGIASGKSTVSRYLAEKGAALVDADVIAREIVAPGSPVLGELVNLYGQDILENDGELNRQKLGGILFSSEEDRQKINQIMHPAIRREILRQRDEAQNNSELVVLDIPLLFEAEYESEVDQVMVVYADYDTQIDRLMTRDNLSKEKANQKIKSQMPLEEKAKQADIIIDNHGKIEETFEQVAHWLQGQAFETL